MPRYEVSVRYTGAVWLDVEADTPKEAKSIACEIATTSDLQCGEWEADDDVTLAEAPTGSGFVRNDGDAGK